MSNSTFAADVTFTMGLANLVADVVPVKKTGADSATGLKYVCPACNDPDKEPVKPQQRYVCPACDGSFWPTDLRKAKELDDGTLRRMSDEEITAMNAIAMDPGEFIIQVCPAEELDARTAPSGTSYRVRLASGKKARKGKQQAKGYALFRALASDPRYALYGVARLNARCNPTPFRLRVWRDQLLLEGLIRPQDLTEPEVIEADFDQATLEMGRQLRDALSASLDEDSFENERAKKLAEILATDAADAPVPLTPAAKDDDDGPDLMTLLTASLDKAKAA